MQMQKKAGGVVVKNPSKNGREGSELKTHWVVHGKPKDYKKDQIPVAVSEGSERTVTLMSAHLQRRTAVVVIPDYHVSIHSESAAS